MAKTTKRKTVAAKKPTVVKRTTVKKKSARADEPQFMEARITEQTLYWLIFGAVAIMFAMWIFTLDSKIQKLYDQVDASSYSIEHATPREKVAE